MDFVIRADASAAIGTGHVMRCLALGQMLIDSGHRVHFVSRWALTDLRTRVAEEGFVVHDVSPDATPAQDAEQLSRTASDHEAVWVFLDGYSFDGAYQAMVKRPGRMVCIDDTAKGTFQADAILNPNLNAQKLFRYQTSPETRLLLGTEFVLLRREFRNVMWRRAVRTKADRILITMGGSDPGNVGTVVVRALERISEPLEIKIVAGPGFTFHKELESACRESRHRCDVATAVQDMSFLMQWCDLAISAAGSTLWELARLQTPVITGAIADNQRNNAEQLAAEGCGITLGDLHSFSEAKLIEAVRLLQSAAERNRLSRSFGALIPEKPMDRLYRELMA